MKKPFIFLTILLTISCNQSDYKTIDFGSFEITVPRNWKEYEMKGMDSYVGGLITSERDTLIFDLGWYSGDITKNPEFLVYEKAEYIEFSDAKKEKLKNTKHLIVDDYLKTEFDPREYFKHQFKEDNIDCFTAKFITPTNKGFGASGIYIDSLKGSRKTHNKTSMSFYGNNLSDSIQTDFFSALKTMRLKKYCSKQH